jgi:hypothetical protein
MTEEKTISQLVASDLIVSHYLIKLFYQEAGFIGVGKL